VSLVMEMCHGGDLLDVVLVQRLAEHRGLPELAAASVGKQLLTALAFLHDQSIIHRDVKCENLFMQEPRGSVPLHHATFKLGDFGFATRLLPNEVLLGAVGSRSTFAPEVILGRPYARPADIWSAGAVLFTALAACRPFEECGTALEVARQKAARSLPLVGGVWDDTTNDAKALISALTQPRAEDRPDAARALSCSWLS